MKHFQRKCQEIRTEGENKKNIAHTHPKLTQMTHWVHSRRPLSTQRDYTSLFVQLQHKTHRFVLQKPCNTKIQGNYVTLYLVGPFVSVRVQKIQKKCTCDDQV